MEPSLAANGTAVSSFVDLATTTTTTSTFVVAVPDSPTLDAIAAAQGGVVNVDISLAGNGLGTDLFAPITMSTGDDATSFTSRSVPAHDFAAAAFPRPLPRRHLKPRTGRGKTLDNPEAVQGPGGCMYNLSQQSEAPTTVGELHVADIDGMWGGYEYNTESDSTISVGLEGTNDEWQMSGTVGIDHALSTGSNASWPVDDTPSDAGNHYYMQSSFTYDDYVVNTLLSYMCPYTQWTQPVNNIGDIYPDTKNLAGSLGHDCYDNQYAKIPPDGKYGTNTQTAKTYSAAATLFGFTFSATTGFTTNIGVQYVNLSWATTYACSSNDSVPPQSTKVLYDTTALQAP